jgi:predicted lipid carrier protein YhbT
VAAATVFEDYGTTLSVRDIPVPPLHEANQHRLEVQSFAREVVLEAGWVRLVLALLQDALNEQPFEARREHVASDAEVLLHLIEAVRAQE